jgi:hypothetical protein
LGLWRGTEIEEVMQMNPQIPVLALNDVKSAIE